MIYQTFKQKGTAEEGGGFLVTLNSKEDHPRAGDGKFGKGGRGRDVGQKRSGRVNLPLSKRGDIRQANR